MSADSRLNGYNVIREGLNADSVIREGLNTDKVIRGLNTDT